MYQLNDVRVVDRFHSIKVELLFNFKIILDFALVTNYSFCRRFFAMHILMVTKMIVKSQPANQSKFIFVTMLIAISDGMGHMDNI